MPSDERIDGGHANRIQHQGPFVIGTDFEPPTPAATTLYRIKLTPDALDKINECIARTATRNADEGEIAADQYHSEALAADAFKHADLYNGVSQALSYYVWAAQFQPHTKDVRKRLARAIAAIRQFEAELPDEYEATGRFLRDTFTGRAFLRDDLKPSESDLNDFQTAWDKRYGFAVMRNTLQTMQNYVQAAQELLGKARPPSHHVLTFVRALARVWEAQTGKKPTSGRDPATSRQSGPFADFVRAAFAVIEDVEINNESGKSIFPSRKVSFDVSIRKVCDESRD